MQKKVAFFFHGLLGGGVERVMLHLARGFVQRGIGVDMVLQRAEGPLVPQVPPQVRVIDLGAKRMRWALPGLVRYLRAEHPPALLAALDHANVVAILAKAIARVPTRVVVSVHFNTSQVVRHARSFRDRSVRWWTRSFYSRADTVVAVSRGVAEDLVTQSRLPREKVRVIYNPVVTPELFRQAEEDPVHPWFTPGSLPVILGVGRLSKQKDFATLIRAFARARRARPARLVILGEGEERPNLERLVQELGLKESVSLPGFVENPFPFMKRAAVFVLSSRWEGLPTVLIEALALGTPAVATDCPSGPAEILEGGKWGRLVPVGDEQALAQAILETLEEPFAPPGAPERMRERFGLESVVDQYLEVLRLK
ncbi:MAG: glycosyltransferase [Candidatus Bipolaricaulota bacterium]|nr:glycosyltransferase [Candidatus Bipolaricaulota bacterium]MDW8127392.1 glycosyltransferase [Candidatus Bipolaricaulota bacterium]